MSDGSKLKEKNQHTKDDIEYLSARNVATVIDDMVKEMLAAKPDEVVHFMHQWSRKKMHSPTTAVAQIEVSEPTDAPAQRAFGDFGPQPLARQGGGGSGNALRAGQQQQQQQLQQPRRASVSRHRAGSFTRHASWASTTPMPYSTRLRYDDGINDVRKDKHAPIRESTEKIGFPELMNAIRVMGMENKLPLRQLETALIEHLNEIDPNGWLTDVEKVSATALFLFSFSTYGVCSLPSEERSGQRNNKSARSSQHHTPTSSVLNAVHHQGHQPSWHYCDNQDKLPVELSHRVEELYRQHKRRPIVRLGNAASPSVFAQSSHAIERDDPGEARKLLKATYRNLPDEYRPPWPLLLTPSHMKSPHAKGGDHDEEEEPSASVQGMGEKDPDALGSVAHQATDNEVLSALQLLYDMECIDTAAPNHDAEGASASQDPSSFKISSSLPPRIFIVLNERHYKIAYQAVSEDFDFAGTPQLRDIYRFALSDEHSFRSVLQACATKGTWTVAEGMVADALQDALNYSTSSMSTLNISGLAGAGGSGSEHDQRSGTRSVYKLLASEFKTWRMFASGRLVTFIPPTLATTSSNTINALCNSVNPAAPPPIRFQLQSVSAVPLNEHSMFPRNGDAIIPPSATFVIDTMDQEDYQETLASRVALQNASGESGEDDDDDISSTIVAMEVDQARVLQIQLKRSLRQAPSLRACDMVWSILRGKKVLRFAKPPDDEPVLWVVKIESEDVPLEDVAFLHKLEGLVEAWSAAYQTYRANNPTLMSPMATSLNIPSPSNSPPKQLSPNFALMSPDDPVFEFSNNRNACFQINLKTFRGRLYDISPAGDQQEQQHEQQEQQEHAGTSNNSNNNSPFKTPVKQSDEKIPRSISIRPLRGAKTTRAPLNDADVQYLCKLLKLNPPVLFIEIDGHPEVTHTSLEAIYDMLMSNSIVKRFLFSRCKISQPDEQAIAALASCSRRHGTVQIPNLDTWASDMTEQCPSLVDPFVALSYAFSQMETQLPVGALELQNGVLGGLFKGCEHWVEIGSLSIDNVRLSPDVSPADIFDPLRGLRTLDYFVISSCDTVWPELVDVVAEKIQRGALQNLVLLGCTLTINQLVVISEAFLIGEQQTREHGGEPSFPQHRHSFEGIEIVDCTVDDYNNIPDTDWREFEDNINACVSLTGVNFAGSDFPSRTVSSVYTTVLGRLLESNAITEEAYNMQMSALAELDISTTASAMSGRKDSGSSDTPGSGSFPASPLGTNGTTGAARIGKQRK